MKASWKLTWILPDGSQRISDGYEPLNLLGHGEMLGIGLPQACGGQAECGTCRVQITKGAATEVMGDELLLRRRHPTRFEAGERLACRARPRGDLKIRVLKARPEDLREL